MDTEKLRKLHQLKEEGILSEEEFLQQKEKLLNEEPPRASGNLNLNVSSIDSQQYAMFIHVSLLIGLLFPLVGLVVPVILWLIRRDDPYVEQHGKIVMNWLITALIIFVCGLILMPLLIGFPILFALGICHFAFAIIGGLKAKSGELWRYPLSYTFLKD